MPEDLLPDYPDKDQNDLLPDYEDKPDLIDESRSIPKKAMDLFFAPQENAWRMGSGFFGTIVGGLAGLTATAGEYVRLTGSDKTLTDMVVGDMTPTDVIHKVQEKFTYGTGWGRNTKEAETLNNIANIPMEAWSEHVAKKGGEFVQEELGAWPSVAAGIEVALELAPWIVLPAAYRAGGRPTRMQSFKNMELRETFDLRLEAEGVPKKEIPRLRKEYLEAYAKSGEPYKVIHDIKSVVTPIGTGSPKAQAIVKNYANEVANIDVNLARKLKIFDKRFSRKDAEAMGEAAIADELAIRNGEKPTAVDALPLDQKMTVKAIQAEHMGVAGEAMKASLISVSNEGYFPRVIIKQLGLDAAQRIHGTRAVKTATKHAKQRKYRTVEETEAAAMEVLGEARVSRDIRQYFLLDSELLRGVRGRQLVNEIKEFGTKTGTDAVIPWDGKTAEGYFRLDNPAFVETKPQIKTRPEGETGPKGGKKKIRRDEEGEVVWERRPLQISKEFEGPLRAALETSPNRVYQGIMKLKMAQMYMIMISPLMHGQVIWGKALPFQPGRTLSFKNYFDGHRIENITDLTKRGRAKRAQNDGWVRQKSGGEFKTTEELLERMILDGHRPMGNQGWYQRMADIMKPPELEAGRSVVSKVIGAPFRVFGKGAQSKAMGAVDWAGHFWHDTLLWDQVRASGYGMYFNLRQNMIRRGVDADVAGKVSAHLANRFTGSIPFEDMSAGVRATANAMLFSKSFTGTNMGLYTDALRGLPRAVQSQLIDAGATLQSIGKANSKLRAAAGAALMKDIVGMYIINSMAQNLVQLWQESDPEIQNIINDSPAFDKEAAFAAIEDIKRQYADGMERYTDPMSAWYEVSELQVNALNDPGKRQRVRTGVRPDGTVEYARTPIGKVGEDLEKSMTDPIELAWNKLSPVMGWVAGVALNDKSKQRDYDIEVWDEDGSTVAAIGDIVHYFFETSTPTELVEAFVDAAMGGDKEKSAYKAAWIFAGIHHSRGAPGGPERGAIFELEEKRQRAFRRVSPRARELFEEGKYQEAAELLIGPGMVSPNELESWFEHKAAPIATEGQIAEFMMYADSLERKRLEQLLRLKLQDK